MKRTLLKFAFVMIAMAVFHSAYAIDKLSKRWIAVKSSSEVTSLDGLKSAEYFFLQDETGKFLYIPSGWDMKVKSELDQNDDYGILYKLQAEGDHYLIPIYNLNKSRRTFWAGEAYVNTQPAGNRDVIFGLGLNGSQFGQDGANLALWDITYEAGRGFAFKNVGREIYLASDETDARPSETIKYWKAYTEYENVYMESEVLSAYTTLYDALTNETEKQKLANAKTAYDSDKNLDTFAEAVNAAIDFFSGNLSPNQDVTSFITNPTIDGLNGWTADKLHGGNGPLLGNEKFEYWNERAVNGHFNYYQTITGLPEGVYTVSAEMYNSLNGVPGAEFNTEGQVGVYAATATAEKFAPVTVANETLTQYTTGEITVTDGTLTIGVKNVKTMTARWFVADNFKMTYVRGLTEEEKAEQPEIDRGDAVNAAEEMYDDPIPSEALAELKNAVNSTETATDYNAAAASVWTAINKARTAQIQLAYTIALVNDYSKFDGYKDFVDGKVAAGEVANLNSPQDLYYAYAVEQLGTAPETDYTGVILNADIKNTNFWGGSRVNSGEQYTGAPDNTYFDIWNANLNANQTIKGLPAGKYHIKAATRGSADASGHIYISVDGNDIARADINHIGNTDGELGNGWSWTETEFTLSSAKDVTIGVWEAAGNYNWAGLDDWQLTYLGVEASVSMSVKAGKYGTFIAPFDVTIPEGVKAYKVNEMEADGITVKLEDVATTITANTPVVLENTTETNVAETFTGIDTATADTYTDGLLTGVYNNSADNPYTIPASDAKTTYYVLQTQPAGQAFYIVKNDYSMKTPNRAYLSVPSTSGTEGAVKAIFFPGQGDATGINAVSTLLGGNVEGIYTVGGAKVNNLQKGVNIIRTADGKTTKVLVK